MRVLHRNTLKGVLSKNLLDGLAGRVNRSELGECLENPGRFNSTEK